LSERTVRVISPAWVVTMPALALAVYRQRIVSGVGGVRVCRVADYTARRRYRRLR
jgi:hypothetical protein